jgi:lantibiotic modifying enzyme
MTITAVSEHLAATERLVDAIVDASIWHGHECTWVGAVPPGSDERPMGLVFRTLGADIYGGTAGVALVLAQAAHTFGSTDAARTAVGAMRHALARRRGIAAEEALGFFAGWSGIAYAAAAVAELVDEPSLRHDAALVVAELGNQQKPAHHDMVFGAAGAVAALVALGRRDVGRRALETAARLGDSLIEAARGEGDALWWPNPHARSERGLTGLSHGAAGIGWALLELADASGEPRFLDAAEQAFAYERRWMQEGGGNWLDFRSVPRSRRVDRAALPAGVFWCHGAPGIMLTRLRAYEVTGNDVFRDEAAQALMTTWQAVEASLASRSFATSLCHGLAGTAAILDEAMRSLGDRDGFASAIARAATALAGGLDRVTEPEADTPGLMLGTGGLAHALLRLADPSLAFVLLPR